MAKYSIYHGKFKCHECKTEVSTVRHYPESTTLTWLCPEGHMSSVMLKPEKKNKKDYAVE